MKLRRRTLPEELPFLVTGRIPEADQDAQTFTLREIDPPNIPGAGSNEEISFRFGEHLFEMIMDAFDSPERVIVVGERMGAGFFALDVRFAASDPLVATSASSPSIRIGPADPEWWLLLITVLPCRPLSL